MKMKILLILLIAAIACVEVKEETTKQTPFTEEDIARLKTWLEENKGNIEEAMFKIGDIVEKAIKWLKDHGVYETIINLLTVGGKYAAIAGCSAYLSPFICEPVISFLFSLFKK